MKTVVKKHLQRGNGRKSVVFEQEFPQIVQLIAIRDVEVQFERPDSPILIAIWPELERRVDKIVPYYWTLKRLAEIVNEAPAPATAGQRSTI